MTNILSSFRKKWRSIATTAVVSTLAMSSVVQAAQLSMNDPERDAYYSSFSGKSVVFVPVFMGLDLTEGWNKMMEMQSKALGYKYQVRNANFNTQAGTRILTSLIHQNPKPDVIVVHNPDVTSYARLEKQAEKEGIFVIQLNMKSTIMTSGFVGGDAVQIGKLQAESVVNHCGPKTSGKVLILTGPTTSPWSVYMEKGYQEVLSKHPNIKVVARQSTGNYDSSKAKSITQVVLQQHPDLCGVMGVWDVTDQGTVAAIKDAGKKGKVFVSTSGGGGTLACKLIEDGSVDNYVSYDVPGQGRDLDDLISASLQAKARGEKPDFHKTALYTPLHELTKESIKKHPCWSVDTMRY
ncbi:sugar ABC transporter substrate-binding protein [Mangrovitalea sediminis]|uniref:sugar ABC transporter substrate-binding protein n=1 Tax=Mangrovitalea sediminis TaxID=1982043 RepID=UPI000BE55B31|nr:sugar ABC transporter substrate-binding protein [Mangrovitalea sediminis]